MTWRGFVARLIALARSRRLERELADEVMAHLELAERDARLQGMPPEEARRVALRQFGGIEQMREEHRDHRSFRSLENLGRDLRYGFHSLARDPGFAAIAIGVLALGIGANVAMFSIVDAVLLKPLPFVHPERLVRIWEAPRPGVTNATSTPDFLDWRRLGTAFDALSAEIPVSMALSGSGTPARLTGRAVTGDYFRVFVTTPLIGRTFRAEEDSPAAEAVVILSHATWQTHFGADPNILERRVILDGVSHQVIGVLQSSAAAALDRSEFWKPLVLKPDQQLRESHWLMVHGRLREGVDVAEAREQMNAVHEGLREVTPLFKRQWKMTVEPLEQLMVGANLRRSILVAFGAVVLVLLIACANVANLLLAKGATRTKEMAIRAALGATRGRMMAQMAAESLALCLLGAVAGLGVAWFLIELADPFVSKTMPATTPLSLDYRLLGFTAAIALGVSLIVGALPSLQASSGSLEQTLRKAARGSSGAHHSIRRAIVIAEVALSVVLVCGALLLFQSLLKLQRVETGVRIDNVITMSLDLPAQSYPTPAQAAAFYESVRERMQGVPGVQQVAVSTHLPLRWIGNGEGVEVAGIKEPINVRFKRVDPNYFRTFDIPLLAGRGIAEPDRRGAKKVVVINETLGRRLADVAGWKNPVGNVVRLYCPKYLGRGTDTEEVEIVGMIRSERVAGPGAPDPAVVYVPLAQVPAAGVKLIVRTQQDAPPVIAGIREALRGIDSQLPLGDIATMQEIREATLAGTSRPAWVIGSFALIAALLTAIGLYGVLSQVVTQRRREIGIRMALGAGAWDVVRHVMGNGFSLISIGLAIGLCGAFALTRVMKSMLFGVSPLDPFALTAACLAMMLVGLMAGFVPASRAARVDPVTTLRDEG